MQSMPDPMREALQRLLDITTEHQARAIVRAIGRDSAQSELERVIAQRLARRLLDQRVDRRVICDRLVSRGISRATAYRVVRAVLDGLHATVSEPTDE